MSWTRIPHPAQNACCPWPRDCACDRVATQPARAPRPAPTPRFALPPAPPREPQPTDLGASGDSWERVLRRLAAEEAARRARARNPWFSEERPVAPRRPSRPRPE